MSSRPHQSGSPGPTASGSRRPRHPRVTAKPRPVRRVALRPRQAVELGSGPVAGAPRTLPPGTPLDEVELGTAGAALGLGSSADFDLTGAPPAKRRRDRLTRFGHRSRAADQPALLRDEHFRIFWLNRVMVQTAQGALLYAFLLLVADRTDSATLNSLFVICSILPSIAFGLPAGVVVDVLPRRPLMISLNIARFVFAVILVVQQPSLIGIFAATLGLWTIHQFYAPSESAALTALVPRDRYLGAQALSNLALTLAQLLGLVILAPLLLKTLGPRALFAVCATLFFLAVGFASLLPRLDDHLSPSGSRRQRRTLRATLLDGWRGARSDETTYSALANDVLIAIGMSSLVVIMPLYLKRVLNTPAENTVFVFAPAAIGLVVGLRYAPMIGRLFGPRQVATAGLVGFATCVGALGFVQRLRDFLVEDARLPLNQIADLAGIPSLVVVAMLLSVPAGFCSAVVSVTARSMLLAHTPAARRGQTIATTTLLGNVGALVPTLLAGVAADLFGVEPIAVAIAVVLVIGGVAARTVARPVVIAPSPST